MKSLLKSLVGVFLLTGFLATSAQALTIRLFTKVAGYNNGDWIEIVANAPKAKPAKINGNWVTDRVQRTEPLLVKITDNNPGPCDWDFVNATVSINGKQVSKAQRWIPEQGSFQLRIHDKPSSDNVLVKVKSQLDRDYKERRVPIGSR